MQISDTRAFLRPVGAFLASCLLAAGTARGDDPHGTPITVQPIPEHHAFAPYPIHAARCGENGEVVVSFTIETDGSVSRPSIQHSSGYADLDAAALIATTSWRYKPVMVQEIARDDADCSTPGTQAAASEILASHPGLATAPERGASQAQ